MSIKNDILIENFIKLDNVSRLRALNEAESFRLERLVKTNAVSTYIDERKRKAKNGKL